MAFAPHSRRLHHPRAVDTAVEEAAVRLRKTLTKRGYDAGADTIATSLHHHPYPSRVHRLAHPAPPRLVTTSPGNAKAVIRQGQSRPRWWGDVTQSGTLAHKATSSLPRTVHSYLALSGAT